jgi:hypothetical protein
VTDDDAAGGRLPAAVSERCMLREWRGRRRSGVEWGGVRTLTLQLADC